MDDLPLNTTIMIRHAESDAQAGAASSDAAQIPLSRNGHSKAAEFAAQLPRPDLIVVSPFIRTRQTARPLMERYPDVPVDEWPVQEFTYLDPARCTGMTARQRVPMVSEYWERGEADFVDGDGAESFSAFLGRVDRFMQMTQKLQGRTYIFSHAMFMQAVRMKMECRTGMPDMPSFRDACINNPVRNLELMELAGSGNFQRETAVTFCPACTSKKY